MTNFDKINQRSRNWFFTIPAHIGEENPISPEMVKKAFSAIDDSMDYVFQMEQGEKTGYEHYQSSIFCSRNVNPRRKDVLKILKESGISDAHVEITRRADAAAIYCSKSKTRIGGPWYSSEAFKGRMEGKRTASKQGQRTDINALRTAIKGGLTPDDLLLDDKYSDSLTSAGIQKYVENYFIAFNAKRWSREQRELKVHYVWGPTGVGKSRYVYENFSITDLYVAHFSSRDPFANYRFQKVLVIDEFRSQTPISNLLQILDRYPYEIDRRYQNSWAAWNEVFILSNWALQQQYKAADAADKAALERRITDITHMTGVSK